MNEHVQMMLEKYSGLFFTKSVRIALILACTFLAYKAVEFIISRLVGFPINKMGNTGRQRGMTLLSITQHIIFAVFCFFALISVLKELDIDTTSLLAGVSIIGLSIGVGAQSMVKDFAAGFFILVENQYALGDIVKIKSITGKVIELTLRTTKIESTDHVVHIVPNGLIDTVTNYSKETYFGAVRIAVSQEYGPDMIIPVLQDALKAVADRPGLKAGATVGGLSGMDGDAYFYDVILPAEWIDSYSVCAAYRCEVARRFNERGIVLRSLRIGGPDVVEKKEE